MIAYRYNPRYPVLRDVRTRRLPDTPTAHNLKTRPEELGPYRDRANARHALRDFARRQGRPRSDFEIVEAREGFLIAWRAPAELQGLS